MKEKFATWTETNELARQQTRLFFPVRLHFYIGNQSGIRSTVQKFIQLR